MNKLLLGSNSPRRNELLADMGYTFEKVIIDCNEDYDLAMPVAEVAAYLALQKSKAYSDLAPYQTLITADTVVIIDGKILNKPADKNDAIRMLTSMSGKSHEVKTGVCIRTVNGTEVFTSTTKVWVSELSEGDIEHYIDTYQPWDKAGAYGIQEWFGMTHVHKIEGCFYNVVGLPCSQLHSKLTYGKYDV